MNKYAENTLALERELSDEKFSKFSALVEKRLGIKMPLKKKKMLQCRLARRVRALEMSSVDEYFDHVFNHGGLEDEFQNFINVVTTNKTEFFREAKHFDILTEQILPETHANGLCSGQKFKLWCAGCSSGEEAYTLAIVLSEFASSHSDFDFVILATDISTKVLEHARMAIYDMNRVESMSLELKKKYLLKEKTERKPKVRIVPELRSKVKFAQVNFMNDEYNVPSDFHVIFFRNVMIYFECKTQERVINRMAEKLVRGGYLFTGHAESLRDLNIPLKMVGNAVYKKQ